MNVTPVFQIAGVAIVVSIIARLVNRAGHEEFGYFVVLVGVTVVAIMIFQLVAQLFNTVHVMFQF